MIREVSSHEDVEAWTRVRNLVVPEEPAALEDVLRTSEREPERRLFLADLDGEAVGCAFVAPSESMPGCAAAIPRVLPKWRRRGLGRALLQACSDHARVLGSEALSSHVRADDEAGLAFAAHRAFVEVDRQVELVRDLGPDVAMPVPPDGVTLVPLLPEQAAALHALAGAAAEDMPLPGSVTARVVDDWIDDLASAAAAVTALADGETVGFASLNASAARPGVLEHGLTAVSRAHRGRGIATAMKLWLVSWATANGYRQLVTWTQKGNRAMQAANEAAGYRRGLVTITVRGPLLPPETGSSGAGTLPRNRP